MNSQEKLKPCAHCGEEAKTWALSKHEWTISCSNEKSCRVMIDDFFTSEENAIKSWNTRVAEPLEEIREKEVTEFFVERGLGVWCPPIVSGKGHYAGGSLPMTIEAEAFCQHFGKPRRLSVGEIEKVVKEKLNADYIWVAGKQITIEDLAQAIFDAEGEA